MELIAFLESCLLLIISNSLSCKDWIPTEHLFIPIFFHEKDFSSFTSSGLISSVISVLSETINVFFIVETIFSSTSISIYEGVPPPIKIELNLYGFWERQNFISEQIAFWKSRIKFSMPVYVLKSQYVHFVWQKGICTYNPKSKFSSLVSIYHYQVFPAVFPVLKC